MVSSNPTLRISAGFTDESHNWIVRQVEFGQLMALFMALRFFNPKDEKGGLINLREAAGKILAFVKATLELYEVGVSTVGTPIGKAGQMLAGDWSSYAEQFVTPSIHVGGTVGARYQRIFGGESCDFEDKFSLIVDRVGAVMLRGQAANLVTVLEHEVNTAVDTPEKAARVCATINSPWLGIAFDDMNLRGAGFVTLESAKAQFTAALPWIYQIHAKRVCTSDPALIQGTAVPEDRLTKLLPPGGEFWHWFLREFAEVAPARQAALRQIGRPDDLFVEIEPHRGKSGRNSGDSDPRQFIDSYRRAEALAWAAGFTTGTELVLD